MTDKLPTPEEFVNDVANIGWPTSKDAGTTAKIDIIRRQTVINVYRACYSRMEVAERNVVVLMAILCKRLGIPVSAEVDELVAAWKEAKK